MSRVSLILIVPDGDPEWEQPCERGCRALEAAGHDVEVLVAVGPGAETLGPAADGRRRVQAPARGRVAAAIEGLLAAEGEILLVLDPADGYRPEDLVRLAAALAAGRADLVVGHRRGASWPRRGARLLTGSLDPLSGLVGLTRPALDAARDQLKGVGSQFAVELLAKVPGRRLDLPVESRPLAARPRPGLEDLRHLKRLADHHFGDFSRLIQFCVVGASGMVVDLSCYAAFQFLFARTALASRTLPVLGKLDLAASAFLAVFLALTWNFALNRRLTFSYARTSSLPRQYLTYALSNALAIALNLTLRLWLPRWSGFFDRHKLAAAVVGIVLATAVSFSMARWVVFRQRPDSRADEAPQPDALRPERIASP